MKGGNNGAETITVNDGGSNNVHMIFVFDFNPHVSHPMKTSGATVMLANKESITVALSQGAKELGDRYWFVGCFLGDDMLGTFIEINELSSTDPILDLKHCVDLLS